MKKFFTMMLVCTALLTMTTGCSDDDTPQNPDKPVQPDPKPDNPDNPESKELSFKLIIKDLNAIGVDFEVVPSNSEAPYLTDIAPQEMVGGMTDEEFVALLKKHYSDVDAVKGDVSRHINLEADTEYVLFAVGFKDGESTSKVAQKPFRSPTIDTPSSEEAPILEISGHPGLPDRSQPETAVTFLVKSDTATELTLLYDKAANIEEALNMGYLEHDLFETHGDKFNDPKQMKELNTNGVTVPIQDLDPGTEYMLLGRTTNKHGFKINRHVVKTLGEAPVEITQPAASIEGFAGNEAGENRDTEIYFKIHCTTKDATEAYAIIAVKEAVDTPLYEGYSLEQIVDANESTPFTTDQITQINSDAGCTFAYNQSFGIQPESSYTFILDVRNATNGRMVIKADVTTEVASKEPTIPEEVLQIDLWCNAGDLFGNDPDTTISVGYKCKSGDAVDGKIGFYSKTDWDARLAAGETAEEIMHKEGKPISSISDFNQWGCNETYTQLTPGTVYTAVCMALNEAKQSRCVMVEYTTMGGTRTILYQTLK